LIRAVSRIENLKLVVAGKIKGLGKQGWMNEDILKEPERLKIKERVIFTDFVPTEELPYLISGSKTFVLVSLWEGFGIPVVEAMACGVPVVVSNLSSLPEVAGDAGIQVNPESETQIEQALRLLASDKKINLKLSKKALEQAKKFSWSGMAKEVIKVLNEA
jgi:glycosyltransferase involved in cell wall biosynthesis